MIISKETINLVNDVELQVTEQFKIIDKLCDKNSMNVLNAFHNNKISEVHFNSTTGYGYDDIGRDAIEKVFAEILGGEDALVRNQLISGSHALNVTLFALLRPNDTMLSISGLPYDTLHEVIGIKENKSSLKSFGINYEQIDLIDNDFNYNEIEKSIKNKKYKLIEIQRSKGYSTRKSLNMSKLEKVIKLIKSIDPEIIIMVDNCYCEFVTEKSPLHIGADIIVGSLIKNLGGGIASNGAYIVGRRDLVELAAERLTLPGEGKKVGPTMGVNKSLLQGLFLSPSVVANSLKTAVLTSKVLENLGYEVEPKFNDERVDIVQNIIFHDPKLLVRYCQAMQAAAPIDAYALPTPSDMPGYDDKVIMASGSFTQGSSIELSCDGPMREPYVAYQQGGLTYNYGKIAVMYAIEYLKK